jgi:hypothetical protein
MRRQHKGVGTVKRAPLQIASQHARPGDAPGEPETFRELLHFVPIRVIRWAGDNEMPAFQLGRRSRFQHLRERMKEQVVALLHMHASKEEQTMFPTNLRKRFLKKDTLLRRISNGRSGS